MLRQIFFIFSCFLFAASISAQKTEEGYDLNFRPATTGLRYYVITEKKDDLWYREAYYIPEKTMAMMGTYKDKDCKIAEGKITWFHPNQNLKSVISYKNGKEEGMVLKFHENGMMRDSSQFLNGNRLGIGLGWDEDGNQTDSTNFDGNGNGVIVKWHNNGTVFYAGRVINDTTRINRWTYFHPNGKPMATEEYVNGKVVHCTCSDESGIPIDSALCIENEAYFPGKDAGWRKFLEKNLNPNVPVKNRAPEGNYMVVVQFVVDKLGNVTEIKPLTKFGFGMEDEVVRLLKRSPRWVPAIQFGRNVKAYRKQPVTFVVSKS